MQLRNAGFRREETAFRSLPRAVTKDAFVTCLCCLFELNGFVLLFSLIWLIGHSTVRLFDWEFWFALLYLAVSSANLSYLLGRRGAT